MTELISGMTTTANLGAQVPQEDVTYAAGFFDGEGCILLYKTANHKTSTRYQFSVQVASVDKPSADWFQSKFGGYISIRKDPRPNHRVLYTWSLMASGARDFLAQLLPYLKLKKEQAELILSVDMSPHKRLTLVDKEARDRVCQRLKELKWQK